MAKNTKELKSDTILKEYWSDNGRFVDLFNTVLFEGRQVIQSEDLEEVHMCTLFEKIAAEGKRGD